MEGLLRARVDGEERVGGCRHHVATARLLYIRTEVQSEPRLGAHHCRWLRYLLLRLTKREERGNRSIIRRYEVAQRLAVPVAGRHGANALCIQLGLEA